MSRKKIRNKGRGSALSSQTRLSFWQRLSTHLNLYNLLFSLLFVLITVTAAYTNNRRSILDNTYSLLSSNNVNRINHFTEWVHSQEESNQFFAARPLVREYTQQLIDCLDVGGDCSPIEERLLDDHLRSKVAIDSDFEEFFIIRASDGMIITGTDSSLVGKFREHAEFFIRGLEGSFTETSAYEMTTGKATMHTATPIYSHNGKTIAVLSGHLNLEKMHGIIQQTNGIGYSEDSYLVNNFNYFLTEPRFGDNYALRRSVFSEGVKDCLAGNSDIAEYADYRGVDVIGAYEWLPDYQICMVSEKDRAEVFAPINLMRRNFYLIGAGLFAASVAFGFFLSRLITNPLRDLSQAATDFGAGNLAVRTPINNKNEIGLFASAFNLMAENIERLQQKNKKLVKDLKSLNQELETRVEDRTKDLKAAQLAAFNIMQDLQEEARNRKKAQLELAKRAKDLKRSNEDLQQFAYVASHDLQEPLRMVASYLQLLEHRYKDKLDQDAREFIDYAVDGATRMKTLINDLLDFSRVGTRGKPFKPTDLNAVMGRVRQNLQLTIEDANATVIADHLPTIIADESQMDQLFQNLIGNAIKFHSEKPPRVQIKARENEKEWIISVADNGIGIDPQYFDRIFTIFQRLHNRAEYPGTGIGLAIARRIIERHNGRVWVESEQGKGTTFFIALPKEHGGATGAGAKGNH